MQSPAAMSTLTVQYYTTARHWASDLEFFRIETAFLHRLMDGYFVRLNNDGHLKELISTGKKLLELEKDEKLLNRMLDEQLTHLELVAEDIIPEGVEDLEDKQAQLQKMVGNLVHEYWHVKKEMFLLVEGVMHEAENQ
jgi:hypothetical protein